LREWRPSDPSELAAPKNRSIQLGGLLIPDGRDKPRMVVICVFGEPSIDVSADLRWLKAP
jgi:hypothetical protein